MSIEVDHDSENYHRALEELEKHMTLEQIERASRADAEAFAARVDQIGASLENINFEALAMAHSVAEIVKLAVRGGKT